VGLVTESAVDWSGVVDIDLTAEDDSQSGPNTEPGESASARLAAIAVDLDLNSADPGEPSRGPQLFDHIRLGFAYQMHLKDEWQKVRLAHVSAARSFRPRTPLSATRITGRPPPRALRGSRAPSRGRGS